MTSKLTRVSPLDRPDYRTLVSSVSEAVWPEFMMHDPVSNAHWDGLFEHFAEYQFAFLDADGQTVAGIANSVPLAWDEPVEALPDEGWDWALIQSALDHQAGYRPRTLCGIQISVAPAYQGQGLSAQLVKEMAALAGRKELERLVVPVRPSLKHRYPLTPMESYVRWTDYRGLPFDPWLRVHARAGGRIVKVCHQAMKIPGSIKDWEEWTGMRFPESGQYVISGALQPVAMDLAADRGLYVEPNVWVLHPVIANDKET